MSAGKASLCLLHVANVSLGIQFVDFKNRGRMNPNAE